LPERHPPSAVLILEDQLVGVRITLVRGGVSCAAAAEVITAAAKLKASVECFISRFPNECM
jgi:hypothetical protein